MKLLYRPGFFGRRRDQIVQELNSKYGPGKWTIVWAYQDQLFEFERACRELYELSYFQWFNDHPDELDFVCSYGECIDNAMSNTQSGMDYTVQEAFSTHIQDIAVRNVLFQFGRQFDGPKDKILVIRSADTEGYRFGPGNIPFFDPEQIIQPSKCPRWAGTGSVEDFWQSNKFIASI